MFKHSEIKNVNVQHNVCISNQSPCNVNNYSVTAILKLIRH